MFNYVPENAKLFGLHMLQWLILALHNLLSLFVAKFSKFKKGDEVIIPAVCWSTSLRPTIVGLKPVFVGVN